MKEAIVYIALTAVAILVIAVALHHGLDVINLNLHGVLK